MIRLVLADHMEVEAPQATPLVFEDLGDYERDIYAVIKKDLRTVKRPGKVRKFVVTVGSTFLSIEDRIDGYRRSKLSLKQDDTLCSAKALHNVLSVICRESHITFVGVRSCGDTRRPSFEYSVQTP